MSLTRHLASLDNPVRLWIDERFPHLGALVGPARAQLRGVETTCHIVGRPPPTIGTAADYRIRYLFGVTPPEQLAAYEGGAMLLSALLHEVDETIPALRDSEDDPEGLGVQVPVDPFEPGIPDNVITAVFTAVRDRVPELRSSDIGPAAVEDELARCCALLALFEEVYRTSSVADSSLLVHIDLEMTLDALLAAVPDDWVTDLTALAALARDVFGERVTRPSVLNPDFTASAAIGGADADLISDGALLEIKTTVRSRLDATWVRQLLGYLLLDTDDEHSISAIGIYLARQGQLIDWPLDEALPTLAGEAVDINAVRGDFARFLGSLEG